MLKSHILSGLLLIGFLSGCSSFRRDVLVSDFGAISNESEELSFDDPFNQFSNPGMQAPAMQASTAPAPRTQPAAAQIAGTAVIQDLQDGGVPSTQNTYAAAPSASAPPASATQQYAKVPFPREIAEHSYATQPKTDSNSYPLNTNSGGVPVAAQAQLDRASELLGGMPTIDEISRQANQHATTALNSVQQNAARAAQQASHKIAAAADIALPQQNAPQPNSNNEFYDPFNNAQNAVASTVTETRDAVIQKSQQQIRTALATGQETVRNSVEQAKFRAEQFQLPASASNVQLPQPSTSAAPAQQPDSSQRRVIHESTSGWKAFH